MRSAAADEFDITMERTATTEYQSQAQSQQLFDSEEMQAIREQYEERLEAEITKREELEWQVRMALAQVRDAEQDALRAADQMRRLHAKLQSLVTGRPEQAVPASPPRPAPVLGVAPVVAAKIAPVPPTVDKNRQNTPPPIPLAAKNSRGPLPPRPLNGYKRVIAQ